MSPIVLYFLHSTSVLSFYIDVVLTLSIISFRLIMKLFAHNDLALCIFCTLSERGD